MENYEELGLTKNESKAYEALVKFGKLGSGEISKESGVSYSKIYIILDSLITKGLVRVIPEKSKKFAPTDPESLIKLIEEKEKKLKETKDKIKEMKTFYDVKEKNPVTMGIGMAGFYKIVKDLKETKKYDYSVKYNVEYRPNWVLNSKSAKKRGCDVKNLVRYDKETKENIEKWIKEGKVMRKIENEGVAMSIQDDSDVMISLIKSNVTLLIKDKAFAKIMKKMYLATYDTAENV